MIVPDQQQIDELVKMAEHSYNEVLAATVHQDDKVGRIITWPIWGPGAAHRWCVTATRGTMWSWFQKRRAQDDWLGR